MPSQITTSQCHSIQTLLPWCCNGTLNGHEQSQVKAHLIDCPSCRAELRQTRELLGSVNIVQLHETRRESARRQRRPDVSPAPRHRRTERSLEVTGYIRFVAAVLLFAGLGYVAGLPQSSNSAVPRNSPAHLTAAISENSADSQVLMVDNFESGSPAKWLVQVGESDAASLDSIRPGDG